MAAEYTARQKLAIESERRSKALRASRLKRDAKILALSAKGLSQLQIAIKVGLTYQRVGQIINKSKEGGK